MGVRNNVRIDNPIVINSSIKPKAKNRCTFLPVFFKNLRESLAAFVGKSIGSKLTRVIYNHPNEKEQFRSKRDALVASKEIQRVTLCIQNPSTKNMVATLDTVIINPQKLLPSSQRKVIVVFNGTGGCYEEHLEALMRLQKDTNTSVVSFNYRGANESQGKASSAADLITDGEAVLDYLTDIEGVDPKNILLYGYSMGGGVAAEVYRKRNHVGPIVSESSFSAFKSAVTVEKGKFVAWLLNKLHWNFSSLSALNTVKEGKLGIVVNRRDPRIVYDKSSLYHMMKRAKMNLLEADSIRRVKIGKKPMKEDLKSISVKSGLKMIDPKVAKSPKSISSNTDYVEAMGRIKKAKLTGELRHAHQMVMENLKGHESVTLSDSMQKKLARLESKAENDTLKLLSKIRKTPVNSLIDEIVTDFEQMSINKLKSVKEYKRFKLVADDIISLNQKFAREDEAAYHEIVKMISHLLN